MDALRLAPRLVPAPLWGLSAAQLLKGARWKRMRGDTLDAAGGACSVCGAMRDKGMICDEVWAYDAGVASLTSLRIICPDCNAVTHIGRAGIDGYRGVARDHTARVNGITTAEADEAIDASFDDWRVQSKVTWTVAIAPDLLARYPDLAELDGRTARPEDGRIYP